MMAKRNVMPKGNEKRRVETGIYQKSSGKYLAVYTDPGRKQHSHSFDKLADARKWRAKATTDPLSVITGKRTLEDLWLEMLKFHASDFKIGTRMAWEQQWGKHIEPAFGNWPIGKITVIAVKNFLAEMERKKVGAATRHKCRSILHRILEEAVENGEIPTNPCSAKGTHVKQPSPKRQRILSAAEYRRLVAATRKVAGESDALAVETMFMLGLRIGEMAALQAGSVHASTGEIVIERTVNATGQVQDSTKTGQDRVLPASGFTSVWTRLTQHIKSEGLIGQAQVFQSPKGGVIRPGNWRNRVWARAMIEAKIKDPPTPHSARRTTGSLLAAAGVPGSTVQAILGHSSLAQTGEYIDTPMSEMKAGLAKLADTLGEAK